MPGEFAPHERTVICWPSRLDLYGDHIGDARLAHAALAKTISGFEPVTMGIPDDCLNHCTTRLDEL